MFTLMPLAFFKDPQTHYMLEEVLACLSQAYGEACTHLAEVPGYGLFANHPAYGVLGGVWLRPPGTPWAAIAAGESHWVEELTQQPRKSWIASHLFFHLPEAIMDTLPDVLLKKLMQDFYEGLGKALVEVGEKMEISHFWVISHLEQHVSAATLGGLPFGHTLPFYVEEREEPYVASLLSTSSQTLELLKKSCAMNRTLRLKDASFLYTLH